MWEQKTVGNRWASRKFLSILLAMAMAVSMLPVTVYAAFSDVQRHWGQTAIEKWSDMGIVRGADGAFRPDDPITRGEMAVVIDNVMNYQTKAENRFSDLVQAFYTDAILKAHAAGVIQGDGATVRPTDNITREEAAGMLARALGLREDTTGGTVFSDYADISPWAVGSVNAMANKGYVKGFNGSFHPKRSITRAEVVTILNSSVKQLYNETREYTGNVSGTAIVNTPGAVLKDMQISGDLIIAEGVGDGDITLDNVTVLGNTLVRGGGSDSIHIQGGSHIKTLIIEKTDDGTIRIVTSDGAVVEAVFVDDGADDIILTGSFESITIAADVTVKAVDAEIRQVDVSAGDAVLDVDQNSVIGALNVAETAADTKITVSGKVETLTANAKVSVNNKGTITKAQINANGVVIEGNAPLTLNVADTVTDKPATGSAPSSDRSSGGSGGGGGSSSRVFAGGNGTVSSPYRVATAAQLDQVRNYLDKHFVLTADIKLSGYANWEPIGMFRPASSALEDAENPDRELAFTGTFDGDNHTISNVRIDQPEGWAIGLFGCAVGTEDSPGSISNLKVENVNATGYYLVGGVVGLQHQNFIVENVTLTGMNKIQGLQGIGGIVGTSFDTVKDCAAIADVVVIGDDGICAGVVVGGTDGGSLINCRATGGSVTATGNSCWALGGVCGAPYASTEITNCTAENVTITASGTGSRLIGGLLGIAGTYGEDAPTSVRGCEVANATINLSDSTTYVGGLVGGSTTGFTETVPSVFAISNCTTSGTITGGTASVGSIVGYAYNSTVEKCTSTMTWDGGPLEQIGYSENAFAGGDGSEESPYQVETAAQLDQVRNYLDKHFVLTADIKLSGYANWEPIGMFRPASSALEDAENPDRELAFTGTFDGDNHTISNVRIDQPEGWAIGLFGCAVGTEDSPGSISNLKVENVNATGYYLVGGVVGLQHQNFIVENVTLTGMNKIQGLQGIGGIVGTSFDTVKDCAAIADVVVIGDDGICAGVVVGGTDGGSLINCRATGGSVTATGNSCWALGGVCGAPYASPEITNCTAENVTITASGTGSRLIGGLLGIAGTYGEDAPTLVRGCEVANATINLSDSTTYVGGLVGGSTTGFTETVPSVFAISNCTTSGAITGGTASVGSIVGYVYNSTVDNCTSTMTWDGGPLEQIGYSENAFAGGDGSEESPYQIETAAQLDQVRNYLDKHFVLTADIELFGYANWEPIGMFRPASSAPEDAENPDRELAFTGTFDGDNHTISNVCIDQPEGWVRLRGLEQKKVPVQFLI